MFEYLCTPCLCSVMEKYKCLLNCLPFIRYSVWSTQDKYSSFALQFDALDFPPQQHVGHRSISSCTLFSVSILGAVTLQIQYFTDSAGPEQSLPHRCHAFNLLSFASFWRAINFQLTDACFLIKMFSAVAVEKL